jgi:hypothetical protein
VQRLNIGKLKVVGNTFAENYVANFKILGSLVKALLFFFFGSFESLYYLTFQYQK